MCRLDLSHTTLTYEQCHGSVSRHHYHHQDDQEGQKHPQLTCFKLGVLLVFFSLIQHMSNFFGLNFKVWEYKNRSNNETTEHRAAAVFFIHSAFCLFVHPNHPQSHKITESHPKPTPKTQQNNSNHQKYHQSPKNYPPPKKKKNILKHLKIPPQNN